MPTFDELVRTTQTARASLAERERQANGEFWREDGKAWSGGVPVGGFSDRTAALSSLKNEFAPVDVISDITAFHCDAIDGTWSVSVTRPLDRDEKPNEVEQRLIDRAEALLTSWWDERDAPSTLRTILEALQWTNIAPKGKRPLCVAPGRVLIPRSSTERREDGRSYVVAKEPEDAALKLHLEAPSPLFAGAIRDDQGIIVGHFYSYTVDGQQETEICALGKHLYPDLPQYAMMTFVEQRRYSEVKGRAMYDLGGMLLHDERSTTRLLITDSILSEQRQLNTANTLKGVNLKEHGFAQEVGGNFDIPGHWEDGSGTPITEKQAGEIAGAKFKADPQPKGPGIRQMLEGTPIYDAHGQIINRATPMFQRLEPSSSQEFRDAINHSLDLIYMLSRQAHRRMSADSTASGESRVQALQDFQLSLEPTKRQYEALVQWCLTTILRLSAVLAGQTGLFDSLRVVCTAKDAQVQPSPDRVRVLIEAREKGQIPEELYLEQAGWTSDIDATMLQLATERGLPEGAKEKLDVLLQLLDKGILLEADIRREVINMGLIEGNAEEAKP